MPSHLLPGLVLAATFLVAASAAAEPLADECILPGSNEDPLAHRAELLARYEQLPHACLQELVRTCSQLANRTLLDFGSAAACSLGYEALLSQRFGGNFQALMAWWKSQRAPALQ